MATGAAGRTPEDMGSAAGSGIGKYERKEGLSMWKRLKSWKDSCVSAAREIAADEDGVGVVEIILIMVENLTTQNPCGYC